MSSKSASAGGLLGVVIMVLIAHPVVGQDSTSRITGYQVGAFVDRAHAEATMKKLGDSDLFAEVRQRTVKGVSYWVVMVSISDIPFENIRQKLLDAGFPVLDISKVEWDQLTKL